MAKSWIYSKKRFYDRQTQKETWINLWTQGLARWRIPHSNIQPLLTLKFPELKCRRIRIFLEENQESVSGWNFKEEYVLLSSNSGSVHGQWMLEYPFMKDFFDYFCWKSIEDHMSDWFYFFKWIRKRTFDIWIKY